MCSARADLAKRIDVIRGARDLQAAQLESELSPAGQDLKRIAAATKQLPASVRPSVQAASAGFLEGLARAAVKGTRTAGKESQRAGFSETHKLAALIVADYGRTLAKLRC